MNYKQILKDMLKGKLKIQLHPNLSIPESILLSELRKYNAVDLSDKEIHERISLLLKTYGLRKYPNLTDLESKELYQLSQEANLTQDMHMRYWSLFKKSFKPVNK